MRTNLRYNLTKEVIHGKNAAWTFEPYTKDRGSNFICLYISIEETGELILVGRIWEKSANFCEVSVAGKNEICSYDSLENAKKFLTGFIL